VGGRTLHPLRKTWTNSSPEKPIRDFDFISSRVAAAAPFLIAVTAESESINRK
jgi:hypothetical protein